MKPPSPTRMTVIGSILLDLSSAALLQVGLKSDNLLSSSSSSSSSSPQPPVISTSSGRIHGTIDPALPNVHQYFGIPYAEPPIGDRRWTSPELLDQPAVDVQATQLPPSCMQYLTKLGDTIYTRDVLEYNVQGLNTTGNVSEDCLTLSVWAPATNTSNNTTTTKTKTGYPVVLFIHGGAFGVGGQNVPYQIPAQWVNRDPNHIVVSFNYRLNIFGFPSAAGLDQQNFGLLDQRAAVEWVQANIAAFGGDPEQMVLWGNSAGSISVDYYNFAYPSDPIVKGFIMDSGTALSPTPTNDTLYSNFTFVAENVGCAGLAGDPGQQVDCMRGVDAHTIEGFVAEYRDSQAVPTILFRPFYDEKLVFSDYIARAEAGLQAQIPAIIGGNAQDGVAFAPYNPNGPNMTIALIADLYLFFCPTTETIRLRQQTPNSTPTYRYEYYGYWPNVSPRQWMGAYHASELPMIMGTHPDYRGNSTAEEYATSQAFQDAYAAFARDPAGFGSSGVEWQAYTTLGSQQVRGFGYNGVPAQNVLVGTLEAYCDGAGIKTS